MMTPNTILWISGKTLLLALSAPLVSGFIRKVKNCLRMRKGPDVFQPYYDVQKLFQKDEVISKYASWIFYAAPVVVFASSIAALFLILIMPQDPSVKNGAMLLIAVFFVLGLGRFFLALAGLDTASAFGGMGSSREMFISSFAEPAAFVAVFALGMGSEAGLRVSALLAAFAILMVAIAETSRIPVDNQETHLELTMIHEAMVLEYSGKSLALIALAAHIKQMIFFILLAWYCFPFLELPRWGWALFPARIAAIGLAVACVEHSVTKMRLFRAVDFLGFAFVIALLASVVAGLGF